MGTARKDEDSMLAIRTLEYVSSSEHSLSVEFPIQEFRPRYNIFKQPRQWWKANYRSWRFYLTIYASLAILIAFIVLLGMLVAIRVHGMDQDGRITVYDGQGRAMWWSNLCAHAFISGMGMCILSGTSYAMYCLVPPTREEIDKEHAKGRWLDIGALSLRNILRISRRRSIMIVLLALSSPLVQFFFNPILFTTWSTTAYSVLVAQESLLKPEPFTIQFDANNTRDSPPAEYFSQVATDMHQKAISGQLERLSNKECIHAYAVPLQKSRRNLIIITSTDPTRDADIFDAFEASVPVAGKHDSREQYSWMCKKFQLQYKDQCLYHAKHLQLNSGMWTISGHSAVKYCLSEKVQEHVKLQLSTQLCLIMFGVALFKAILTLSAAFCVYESPLMTTGDAISSFIQRPDPYTKNMCLASKRTITSQKGSWKHMPPLYYQPNTRRWYSGVESRIIGLTLCMIVGLSIVIALYFTRNEPMNFRSLMTLGVGTINHRFFIIWHHKRSGSFTRSIFLANVGHSIFGTIYVLFNNVFAAFIFQAEWSRFGKHRKGLRVSEAPHGKQRSAYFFLMPNRIALPIMFFSFAIHSSISQCLFLVDVEVWGSSVDENGVKSTIYQRQAEHDFSTTGFSPLADILLITFTFAMIGYLLYMSCRRYKTGMPIVSTCSAAISAACHPIADEAPDAHLRELAWGVTHVIDGVGHASFTTKDVKPVDPKMPFL